jgi:hypothetical protein
VRTVLVEQANFAFAVSKSDEILSQELDPNGRAVRVGNFR